MKGKPVSPESILRLTSAHWSLKALAVAVELSVFTELDGKIASARHLAIALKLPIRSLQRLLNANAALGFLAKKNGEYSNTEVAQHYLVKGRPGYLGDFVELAGIHGFAKWTRFRECIANDAPVEDLEGDYRANEKRMEHFTRAMNNNAIGTARYVTSLPEVQKCKSLMDIGGGSGIYSISFAEKLNDLRATVVDFPPACRVAKEFVGKSSAANRISLIEADVLKDEINVTADIVLVSQVLHGMSEEQCASLLERCYGWTNDGGLVLIHEFLLEDDCTEPLYPALFALNMLMTTKDGDSYTKGQLSSWLEGVGYEGISFHDTPGPSTLVLGKKK